jgi:hypothetical protein
MKIDDYQKRIKFEAEGGGSLEIYHDNMGEPFRDGIGMCLENGEDFVFLFIEKHEAKRLRDLLNRLFP